MTFLVFAEPNFSRQNLFKRKRGRLVRKEKQLVLTGNKEQPDRNQINSASKKRCYKEEEDSEEEEEDHLLPYFPSLI